MASVILQVAQGFLRGSLKGAIFLGIPVYFWLDGAVGLLPIGWVGAIGVVIVVLLDGLIYPRLLPWWKPHHP